jgi:hypothetical protein
MRNESGLMAVKTYHFMRAELGMIVQLDISKEYLKRMEFYQISYGGTQNKRTAKNSVDSPYAMPNFAALYP